MNKDILRLAIPNIISNITVPLLGLVDMTIVGHLDSTSYIGGIVVATTLFNFIYWNFSFLRMGTSGFTAQYYGADNKHGQVNTLLRSLLVAVSGGVLLILLQFFILQLGILFFDAGENVRQYAAAYFRIYIWGAPAVLGMYAFNGWFVGMQDAKTPMFISILINVINILLSLLFVFVWNMNIKGVALGSLCAQYAGILTALIICYLKYGYLRKYLSLSVLKHWKEYVPFFKVNANIFIRTLALVVVTTYFVSASSHEGEAILSVNALIMQLFTLFSYLMDGFAYAAEALTGKLIGAGKKQRLRKLVRSLFVWGMGIAVFFTIVYALFFEQILGVITDKQDVILLAIEFKLWALLIPIAGFSAFLWDGIFVGATASLQMRNSMLFAAGTFFGIYLGCKYAFPDFFMIHGNSILWTAFLCYLVMRGIIQWLMVLRAKTPSLYS
ncbi:MATE family efflux transporter [Bacteroides sp. 519]|uniref:MATE family efflux transporter n=1 Tax=Bacteroides sp. 519 TaxID=2302937 RepID=UPI0013D07C9F|nr:MATE family efflux transporter [Bacteroides sp. 519]NDV60679.1 MATE family efflux transporter [Bacteroides sp. 519]